MDTVFVRSAFNYDRDAASNETAISDIGKSLTKQSFAEECDINTIVRRFHLTGELPSNVLVPQYADFTEIFDYHSALNVIAQANEAFDLMPADVRSRFQNDPAAFLDFCNDPNNAVEAVKLGIAVIKTPEVIPTPPTGEVKPSGVAGADTAAAGGTPST
ncbi:MAG: internal scaffolding protein [Microvirus sp.]|nr:MAG: internal scaffolding protein [Microvirus sp.]